MIFVYPPFEVVAILTAILLSLYVFRTEKTYWLEGVLLLFSYILFGYLFLRRYLKCTHDIKFLNRPIPPGPASRVGVDHIFGFG